MEKVVVEDNAMDVFMSGPFLQWVRKKTCFQLCFAQDDFCEFVKHFLSSFWSVKGSFL